MAAKKKTAAKKAARKKKDEPVLDDPGKLPVPVFRPKGGKPRGEVIAGIAGAVRKSIEVVASRATKRKVNMVTPASLRRSMLPVDEFYMQWGLCGIGFRFPAVVEVIAPQGIGKTTWAYHTLGQAIRNGCFGAYIECEDKDMRLEHVQRILSPDPREGVLMLNAIARVKARQLAECDNALFKVCEDLRARSDKDPETKGNPIVVFIDTWSSLLSPHEAKGVNDWGIGAGGKKPTRKDAATVSNQGHAKAAHYMKRYLPDLTRRLNLIVFIMKHQAEDVDMSGFSGPVMKAKKRNTTAIGGVGHHDIAHYIMTLTGLEQLKDTSNRKIGQRVNLFFEKNAYGPPYRDVEFDLIYDGYEDTGERLARPLRYDVTTARWMARNGYLGVRVRDNLFTCEDLGLASVPAEVLYEKFASDQAAMEHLGSILKIDGYGREAR